MKMCYLWNRLPREMVGAPTLETAKVKVGRGSEQTDPIEDVHAHCRGVGLVGL